jgi:hypothetical protein
MARCERYQTGYSEERDLHRVRRSTRTVNSAMASLKDPMSF